MGDTPPKKRPGGKNVRGVGLHAGYTTSTNQRPFLSADPKVEPKNKKKENNFKKIHFNLYICLEFQILNYLN